jgi:hypothetical protein
VPMRRMLTMVALAMLLGCGGATKPDATTPKASAGVREAGGLADAVCACADADCAQAALEKLLTRQVELENAEDRVGLDGAHDRGVVCYVQKTGVTSGATVVPMVKTGADEVCACADAACVEAAVARLREQLHQHQDAVFTTSEQAAMEDAGKRLDGCAGRFHSGAASDEGAGAVHAAETMADEICACPDAECATAAATRGTEALKKFKNAHGTQAQADALGAATKRMGACLDKLTNAAPAK